MQHAFFSCIHSATQYIACILYFNWAFFSVGKESACNAGDLGSIPWRRKWPPIPVFLPGESHGQRSLVGFSSWSHKRVWAIKHTGPCFPHYTFLLGSSAWLTITCFILLPSSISHWVYLITFTFLGHLCNSASGGVHFSTCFLLRGWAVWVSSCSSPGVCVIPGWGFHWRQRCLPGDTWQPLQLVLVVTTGRMDAGGTLWESPAMLLNSAVDGSPTPQQRKSRTPKSHYCQDWGALN